MTTSSKLKPVSNESALELQDVGFDEVFKIITGSVFAGANELQQALFPRLITKDTGLLIPTGPCAGRLEAVVVPSLAGMRVDAAAHRLFIVGPDGRPLDDYAYRLTGYVSALVSADGVERTVWFEEPDRPPIARTFTPEGSIRNGAADHPFSENVDIVAMPFSHFRSTFFGSGGVHGMPEAIAYDQEASELTAPRLAHLFRRCVRNIPRRADRICQISRVLVRARLGYRGRQFLPAAVDARRSSGSRVSRHKIRSRAAGTNDRVYA